MNRVGSLVFAAAVAGVVLLCAQDVIWACVFFFETSKPNMYAIGITGWAIATLGPLALSIYCWSLVKRVHAKWAPHLFFIPCAIALSNGGAMLLFHAGGRPDGDG